jgi:hypothetical protein
MKDLLGWLQENKQWLFSGIGVAMVIGIWKAVRSMMDRRRPSPVQETGQLSRTVPPTETVEDLAARAALETYAALPTGESELVTCQRGEVAFSGYGRVDVEFPIPFVSPPHVEVINQLGHDHVPTVEEVSRYKVAFRRAAHRPRFTPGERYNDVFGWTAEGTVLRRIGRAEQRT